MQQKKTTHHCGIILMRKDMQKEIAPYQLTDFN